MSGLVGFVEGIHAGYAIATSMSIYIANTDGDCIGAHVHRSAMAGKRKRGVLPPAGSALGARLRERLEALSMGANELDRAIGQGSGYTSRLIRGEKKRPDAHIITRAAAALQTTTDYLLKGTQQLASQADSPSDWRFGAKGEEVENMAVMLKMRDLEAQAAARGPFPNLEDVVRVDRNDDKPWTDAAVSLARVGFLTRAEADPSADLKPSEWRRRLAELEAFLTQYEPGRKAGRTIRS